LKITVDKSLDEVKDGFDPVPAGEYTVKIVSAEERDSSSTPGARNVVVKATIEGTEYAGQQLRWYLPLAGAGLPITKRCLAAAHCPWSGRTFESEDLLGRCLRVRVTQEKYQNRMVNKVTDYIEIPD